MASNEKGKKLSKKERKSLMQERGRQGAEARGCGVGSRADFSVPAQWMTEVKSYDHHDALKFISPGKTTYHTTTKVKETLAQRKMDFCLEKSSESSGNELEDEDPDYQAGPSCKISKTECDKLHAVEVERRLVVCESSQIMALIDDVNRTSLCSTPECKGE